jgi:glucokinase
MVIGIDVGGTTIKFGLIKLNGEIVFTKRIDTKEAATTVGIVEAMITEVKAIIAGHPEVEGVGIGLPGLVSKDRKTIVLLPNIPQVVNEPIVAKFKKEIPSLIVKIENDAKCAALGELQFGGAKGLSDYLFITLGTGVGGGYVMDKKLYLGSRGNATEVGHMYTPIEGKTVEQHLGLNQICEYAKKIASQPQYSGSSLQGKEITPKDIFEAGNAGDKLALDVWQHVGTVLGYGLISMMRFSDVNKFVIGGGVAGAFDLFIGQTEKIIRENLPAYYSDGLEFRKASVGDSAGILGAASLIYHSYGEN